MGRTATKEELGVLALRFHEMFDQAAHHATSPLIMARGLQLMTERRFDELGLAYRANIPAGLGMKDLLTACNFSHIDPQVDLIDTTGTEPLKSDVSYWCTLHTCEEHALLEGKKSAATILSLLAVAYKYPRLLDGAILTNMEPLRLNYGQGEYSHVPYYLILGGRSCGVVASGYKWPSETRVVYIDSLA